jgi:hypothetical protein
MRYLITVIIIFGTLFGCMAIGNKVDPPTSPPIGDHNHNNDTTGTKMKISIGSAVFTATLNNSATAAAFKAMLPVSIKMDELNGNEKFYYFPATLPNSASAGGNIQEGDLMLYGNNCLVLFYESFNTSYSYTKIGRITNPSGLKAALGSGSITVRFELQ